MMDLLEARIEDYLTQADRGAVAISSFLSPGERRRAERYLEQRGERGRAVFWGGYPDAERTCLFLLPDFYGNLEDLGLDSAEELSAFLEGISEDGVSAIRVTGSGYRKLSHRDYLGSLLGLGLERDAVGDIAAQSEQEAVVFCKRRLGVFLIETLEKVASDTVRCRVYEMDENFTDGRRYRPISDTVASPRLDCVVAALTNLSREDAQSAVRGGLVEVDFEREERVDLSLTPPATISVRGYGRYVLRSFDGETKKGRLRLRADQLI